MWQPYGTRVTIGISDATLACKYSGITISQISKKNENCSDLLWVVKVQDILPFALFPHHCWNLNLNRFLPRFVHANSCIKMGNMFLQFYIYSWWCWFTPSQASNKQDYPALQPVEIKTKQMYVRHLITSLKFPISKD